MGLGFYMRRKLLNVHIPDLARLAEMVRQTKLMKKEKEKYRKKVAYVTMESSEEEIDFETEVDLAELKKGLPYLLVSSGFGTVRCSKNGIICIDVTHSGDIGDLLEISIPIIVVGPEDLLEVSEAGEISTRVRSLRWK
ncbi:hypothetical protein Ahy_B01g057167 [Arachis hypogaea]|uniref:Uncharacterized protein n=1 Tax=Arachis hypogaea TaxID=3818 RepID=A0A445B0G3_ARAHY|nr:hypothetical protein Ahy_B01g057167 [Arachis hypogaea]